MRSRRRRCRSICCLFAQRIAPPFHIACRFVGQEPLCQITAAYNKMMAEVLEAHAIEWVELPRIQAGGLPISATQVRKAFAEDDIADTQASGPAGHT